MAREIARKLPKGYLTPIGKDRSFGRALLTPTIIYVPLIAACQHAVSIHYAVNITGHGWRKLMRAKENFRYVIETPPRPSPLFRFIQAQGPLTDEEAYGNLNMGAGFALYVSADQVERLIGLTHTCKMTAWVAGYIERAERKEVVIKPIGLRFKASDLRVR